MRRPGFIVFCLLLLLPPSLLAQGRRWALTLDAGLAGFTGAARDTSAGGLEATARPRHAPALGLGLVRRGAAWEIGLGLSVLPSRVLVHTDELDVVGRGLHLDRFRLAPTVARRLAGVGSGSLALRAGPTLDVWQMTGASTRTVLGGGAQLALRLPAGGFELENVVGWGWSGAPFARADLPEGYDPGSLQTLTIGASLRFGL